MTGTQDFLSVDRFIADVVSARGLTYALESGLIDYLLEVGIPVLPDDLLKRSPGLNAAGWHFLLNLLRAGRIVDVLDDGVVLNPEFRHALQYRDLLQAKLEFSNLVYSDFERYFPELLQGPAAFMGKSKIFELFRYDRCYELTPDNLAMTRRWVRYTTSLTRYEAGVCMEYHDFSQYHRILDIGGNSGEFVLRICKAQPEVEACVFDLPVVCEIGLDHVANEPEAERIRFIKGDVRADTLPQGFDLICFKSFLHDWPESDITNIISKAADALMPGGTLMIFERAPIEFDEMPSYAMIPILLFLHFYRSPEIYSGLLMVNGLEDIDIRKVDLEMGFNLITARKSPDSHSADVEIS